MTLQELQNQALNLPTNEKWQLLQTLLSAIQEDTMPPKTTPDKTYDSSGYSYLALVITRSHSTL
jgi:hypothetical protein